MKKRFKEIDKKFKQYVDVINSAFRMTTAMQSEIDDIIDGEVAVTFDIDKAMYKLFCNGKIYELEDKHIEYIRKHRRVDDKRVIKESE